LRWLKPARGGASVQRGLSAPIPSRKEELKRKIVDRRKGDQIAGRRTRGHGSKNLFAFLSRLRRRKISLSSRSDREGLKDSALKEKKRGEGDTRKTGASRGVGR